MAEFFPLSEGAAWTWAVSLDGAAYEERWTARAVETEGPGQGRTFILGWEQRFPFRGEDDFTPHLESVDHYIVSLDGSRLAHHVEITDLTAYPVPGWRQDLEEDEASWLLRADAKPGVPIEIERVVYTLLALDATVTVPAGTFRHCLHIRIEKRTTRETAGPFAGSTAAEWWFAPHIGPVKRFHITEKRVLLDYVLPGDSR